MPCPIHPKRKKGKCKQCGIFTCCPSADDCPEASNHSIKRNSDDFPIASSSSLKRNPPTDIASPNLPTKSNTKLDDNTNYITTNSNSTATETFIWKSHAGRAEVKQSTLNARDITEGGFSLLDMLDSGGRTFRRARKIFLQKFLALSTTFCPANPDVCCNFLPTITHEEEYIQLLKLKKMSLNYT